MKPVMTCSCCGGTSFDAKDNALFYRKYEGRDYRLRSPALVCRQCGTKVLTKWQEKEVLKRLRARHAWGRVNRSLIISGAFCGTLASVADTLWPRHMRFVVSSALVAGVVLGLLIDWRWSKQARLK